MATQDMLQLNCLVISATIRSMGGFRSWFSKSKYNSIVTVSVDNGPEERTEVVKNSNEPKWDRLFTLAIHDDSRIIFRLYHQFNKSSNVLLGRASVTVPSLRLHSWNRLDNMTITLEMLPSNDDTASTLNCSLQVKFDQPIEAARAVENSNASGSVRTETRGESTRHATGGLNLPPNTPLNISLPSGWEARTTESGRVYYIDHNTRTTSWRPPTDETMAEYARFNRDRINGWQESRRNYLNRYLFEAVSPLQTRQNVTNSPTSSNASTRKFGEELLGPLPKNWEWRTVPNTGKVYFIDHEAKNTQWQDPRLKLLVNEFNPLPAGWELKIADNTHAPYFVNHNSQITTFRDPRSGLNLFPLGNKMANCQSAGLRSKAAVFYEMATSTQRSGVCKIKVSRQSIFEDSVDAVMTSSVESLHTRLHIQMSDEKGLDYGGISREWFFTVSQEIMNPMYCLFMYETPGKNYLVQINPMSVVHPNHLRYFRFVGRFLGLALFHQSYVAHCFNRTFFKQLLCRSCSIDDLRAIDEDCCNSIKWIKENNIEENEMEMYFCVEVESFGQLEVHEFFPGGKDVLVTEENKMKYIDLYTQWKLNQGTKQQMREIIMGFNEIIPPSWLIFFDEQELELLLCGIQAYDIEDWKAHTNYKNYSPNSKQIKWFWKAVEEMNYESRARLLQFCTGTSQIPITGFADLYGGNTKQRFCIQKREGATSHLPQAQTCFNRLELPTYNSYQELVSKLTTAMNETTGFHLE